MLPFLLCGLFAVTIGLIVGGHVPSIRGPPVPSDYISVKISMQEGVPARSTEHAIEKVESARLELVKYLEELGELNPFRYVMQTMGAQPFSGGPKSSSNIVTASNMGGQCGTDKFEMRTRSAPQLSALWRERIGPISGSRICTSVMLRVGSRTALILKSPAIPSKS